jgi:hypothetical protein
VDSGAARARPRRLRGADRIGGSTTRLIVEATAERPQLTPNIQPEIRCLPTMDFVDAVFRSLEAAIG